MTGFTAITGLSFLSSDDPCPQLDPLSLLSILEYLSNEFVGVEFIGVITGMESFSVSLSGDLSDTNKVRFTGLGGAVFVSSLSFRIVSMNIGGGGITLPVEATLAIDCFLASSITLGGGGAGRVGEGLINFPSESSPGDCGLFILLVEIFFGIISFVGTVLCGGTGR